MKYGYASAPDVESLQEQVESLEDSQVPTDCQYVELVNHGHPQRAEFLKLIKRLNPSDELVIRDITALGAGLLDAYQHLRDIEAIKNIQLTIIEVPTGFSQDQLLFMVKHLANIFQCQQNLEPTGGKPRKPYPPEWRDAYRQYKSREHTALETEKRLDMPEYEFFRTVHRYETALQKRRADKRKEKES